MSRSTMLTFFTSSASGIGLQERHTLLIRAEGTKDKYPFDLQTDRYFVYDPAEPAKKLVHLSTH